MHLGRWPSALLAVLAAAGCRDSTGASGEAPAFAAPLTGTPMADHFYGAYLDHDPGPEARDYTCGRKAYDGHQGVDLLLRDFRVQDEGVPVVAAAAGVVASLADGAPDRNTTWDAGGFGNHVVLAHGGGVTTIYGHLRRGSVAVARGDRVERGTVLGLVGSSGRSNWPHLHFEVRRDGIPVDPFTGSCGPAGSLWSAQLPYQDAFRVTDAGVTDQPGTLAALLERPPTLAEVPGDAASFLFWLQVANQRQASMRYELRRPDGALAREVQQEVGSTFSMRYLLLNVAVAGSLTTPGEWEIRAFQNGERVWTQPFRLLPAAHAAAPAPVAAAGAPLEVRVLDQAAAGALR